MRLVTVFIEDLTGRIIRQIEFTEQTLSEKQ